MMTIGELWQEIVKAHDVTAPVRVHEVIVNPYNGMREDIGAFDIVDARIEDDGLLIEISENEPGGGKI